MIKYVPIFSGLMPKESPRLIGTENAQTAVWTRLDNTELRAWHEPVRIFGTCPPWTWEYEGSGGAGTGGESPQTPPAPPELNFTPNNLLSGQSVFSCYFNFNEIEPTPGVREVWVSYDYEFGNGFPLRVNRFDLTTRAFLGEITTTVMTEWSRGGISSVETASHMWYFGKWKAARIQKTSPYTVTEYDITELHVHIVPDISNESVWIQEHPGGGAAATATLRQWSLLTQSYTGATKTLPFAYRVAWAGRKMDSDGTIWAVQSIDGGGTNISYLSKIAPGGAASSFALPVSSGEDHDMFYPFVEVNGFLWILSSKSLVKFNKASGTIASTISINPGANGTVRMYTQVAHDQPRQRLYWTWFDVDDNATVKLVGFSLATESVVFTVNAEPAGVNLFNGNYGILVDSLGNVWYQSNSSSGYRLLYMN